jgi:transcription elongation factor GreA
MERFPITQRGYKKLLEELRNLKSVERPDVVQAIAEARELGDLSENAEYHAAREKQSFIEGRILDLEDKSSRSEVIDISKFSGPTVKFGATVHLLDEETEKSFKYVIMSDYEADISKGLLSLSSPISRAVIGKTEGDSVEVVTPKGIKDYEITKVEYIEIKY